MRNTRFGFTSRRIQSEKALKHIGTVQVKLDVLYFPGSGGLDRENVERLKKLFREQRGYSPRELQNRIPAVVDETDLQDCLRSSGLCRDSLSSTSDYPKLNFPPGYRLECLRGEARVNAAKEVFKAPDPRWVVDLFLAGLSYEGF